MMRLFIVSLTFDSVTFNELSPIDIEFIFFVLLKHFSMNKYNVACVINLALFVHAM